MAVTSLLELIERLLTDGDAANQFREAPDRLLADHGLADLSGADVIDALSLGFGSIAPVLAGRLVLPEDGSDSASAADALAGLLDAAPAHSVLADSSEGADVDFGFGDVFDDAASASGGVVADATELALDLDAEFDSVDDLDTATFDQGFGSGSGDVDVDGLADVDDFDFGAAEHDDL